MRKSRDTLSANPKHCTITVCRAMTQDAADVIFVEYNTVTPAKRQTQTIKPISIDEIAQSFQSVAEDIQEIGKLTSQENSSVANFIKSLKVNMEPWTSQIEVNTAIIPIDYGVISQSFIHPNAQLELVFPDGDRGNVDLSEPKHRDLMMAVFNDVAPKFEALTLEIAEERLHPKPKAKPKVQAPAPPPIIRMPKPTPIPTPVAAPEPVKQPEPTPVTPQPPKIETLPADPVLLERNAKIEAITTETLTYLDMLGGEVFEQEPVSKYFDDWMVNLRQVVLSFESNESIGADQAFDVQFNEIFGKIKAELDNRVALEGDMAVSYRTLIENRYLLNKIDEERAEQTKQFAEKGVNNIETLMQSMANIEKELTEAQAVKVSYLHPVQMMAKDQKVSELTQKLNSVKKQLAMAVGSSSTGDGKSGDIDAQFEVQTKILEQKRKAAMELLNKEVNQIANEIATVKMTKTSNPIKRVTLQQQAFDLEAKLLNAKQRLQLAEQNSNEEIKRLKEEYEKKKQAALGKVQTLEKDIATKAVDNSAGVRKEAAEALVKAVKALSEKKLKAPLAAAAAATSATYKETAQN